MRATTLRAGDAVDAVIHWVGLRFHSQRWVWLVPFAVLFAVVHEPTGRIIHITGAIVALGVLAWAIRRPGSALVALVVFLPLQTIGFGFLFALHVPIEFLRPAGGLKELLGAGILISALHALHNGRTRFGMTRQLDAIDKVSLVYVAVVTAYLIFPHLFTLFPVSGRFTVRLLAWRADCGYVLLLFGVRHAPLAPSTRRLFLRVLLGVVVLTVAAGFYQWLAPASWSHFVLVTGQQAKYQTSVLGNDTALVTRNLGYLTNFKSLRVSSIFLSPFDMADFVVIGLAIVVERIARNVGSQSSYLLCAVILGTLFASRVRADALAAVIIALVAMVPTPSRPIAARLRLLGAILVAAAVVIPSLGGTRFVNAEGGSKSNRGHISEITGGLTQLIHVPLGIGIGNAAGVGDRFVLDAQDQGGFTVDNAALQVGNELGFQALLPWLLLLFLVWRALGRAARRTDSFAGGIRLAFLGLLVAGLYHHIFLGFPVTWTLWAAVGLVLRPVGATGEAGPAVVAALHAAGANASTGSISVINAAPTAIPTATPTADQV